MNTHLHFDHCGQNYQLEHAPVWVTAAEIEAAKAEFYTVPEWAEITPERLRVSIDGDEIASGVRLLHTPGHTPGHQSVTVETVDGIEVVVGQTCYGCAEYRAGRPAATDMHDTDLHDTDWTVVGTESLERLRRLDPAKAHFSHDRAIFESR